MPHSSPKSRLLLITKEYCGNLQSLQTFIGPRGGKGFLSICIKFWRKESLCPGNLQEVFCVQGVRQREGVSRCIDDSIVSQFRGLSKATQISWPRDFFKKIRYLSYGYKIHDIMETCRIFFLKEQKKRKNENKKQKQRSD